MKSLGLTTQKTMCSSDGHMVFYCLYLLQDQNPGKELIFWNFFAEYIRKQRIVHFQHLLSQTNMSIMDIAFAARNYRNLNKQIKSP